MDIFWVDVISGSVASVDTRYCIAACQYAMLLASIMLFHCITYMYTCPVFGLGRDVHLGPTVSPTRTICLWAWHFPRTSIASHQRTSTTRTTSPLEHTHPTPPRWVAFARRRSRSPRRSSSSGTTPSSRSTSRPTSASAMRSP